MKNNFEISDAEMADVLAQLLREQEEESATLVGHLTVLFDLVGKMVVTAQVERELRAGEMDEGVVERAVKAVAKSYPSLTTAERKCLKNAARFHLEATLENQEKMREGNEPSWRDDHPLKDIEAFDLRTVVNRYYAKEELVS